ncbi:rhomboid family intramembrane serine protease [Rapidithrix thailandica]|uniref:Rhomboid family intramembrane serine protease n=1 Tax=Rapidithrix thailandica TaxID=413964 RepID=A0AAW9S2R4_9BACT
MWFADVDYLMPQALELLHWGANFNPYTLGTEWWRMFTHLFVHFGVVHLGANMLALFALGREVEKLMGSGPFLAAYLLCGLAGGIVSTGWNTMTISCGASGAIYGLLGISIAYAIAIKGDWLEGLLFLLMILAISIAIDLIMPLDHASHAGGLLMGLLIGLYQYRPFKIFKKKLQLLPALSILLLIVFLILPRSQFRYYQAFQLFLKNEQEALRISRQDYSNDKAYIESLKEIQTLWTGTQKELQKQNHLPDKLAEDKYVLSQYCSLKQKDIEFRLNSIEKESYIYWDSMEIVQQVLDTLPKLHFVLNYEQSPSPASPPVQPTTSQAPLLLPVKLYYDSAWQETEAWDAVYYRVGTQDSLGRWQGKVRDYYLDGTVQMKGYYTDGLKDGVFLYYNPQGGYDAAGVYDREIKTGKWEYFHPNGQLKSKYNYQGQTYVLQTWDSLGNPVIRQGNGMYEERYPNGVIQRKGHYVNGLPQGVWLGYYENGQPYFKEYYEQGDLIRGISYSPDGHQYQYDESSKYPHPTGGREVFFQFVRTHQYYPSEAQKENIQGEVTMIFEVSKQGIISNIVFYKSLGEACDQEAQRLLLEGPAWRPAKLYGQEAIHSQAMISVPFPVLQP